MSKESKCFLARAHGEVDGSKKDTMDVIARPSLQAKMACVRNFKELLNLELKVASVDILALIEKKMTTQVDLVCLKKNHKFFNFSKVLISSHNLSFFIPCFIFWITIRVHIYCLSGG
jgi:hypothetical protein